MRLAADSLQNMLKKTYHGGFFVAISKTVQPMLLQQKDRIISCTLLEREVKLYPTRMAEAVFKAFYGSGWLEPSQFLK